jgi:hypothetical protein
MKKIKKVSEEEVTGFTAKSLETEKEEIIGVGIKTEPVEHDKESEKEVKAGKIQKFESFITININLDDDMIEDDDDEDDFHAEYEEDLGCGCCDDCTGEPGCYCGCQDCKCDSEEDEVLSPEEFMGTEVSEGLKYHLDNNKPVTENIFRPGSDAFFGVIKEARDLFDKGSVSLCDIDRELYESTDIGKFARFNGEIVPLDLPMENVVELNEAKYKGKEVKLNHPMRSSGPKKYKVYVKNPKSGKVICVNFGDVKGGLTAKISDPKARKSFSARHGCDTRHKDKTKAGYWSCRLNKFGHLFGGRTYPGFW